MQALEHASITGQVLPSAKTPTPLLQGSHLQRQFHISSLSLKGVGHSTGASKAPRLCWPLGAAGARHVHLARKEQESEANEGHPLPWWRTIRHAQMDWEILEYGNCGTRFEGALPLLGAKTAGKPILRAKSASGTVGLRLAIDGETAVARQHLSRPPSNITTSQHTDFCLWMRVEDLAQRAPSLASSD